MRLVNSFWNRRTAVDGDEATKMVQDVLAKCETIDEYQMAIQMLEQAIASIGQQLDQSQAPQLMDVVNAEDIHPNVPTGGE